MTATRCSLRSLPAVLAVMAMLSACGQDGAPATQPPSGGPTNQTQSPTAPAQPRVSINGKIAFARGGSIWVIDGGPAHQLATVPGAGDPAWSPDGTTLAFDRQDKNSADLYVMPYPQGTARAQGANANRVVENNFWDMQPDWSSDGLTLAYVSDHGRTRSGTLDPGLWRLTLASGARVQLTTPSQYAGGIDFPRWRPNRRTDVLYTSWAYDAQTLEAHGQLVLEDTQSNRRQTLTPTGEFSFHPAWSPDGSSIAYVRRTQQRDDLWIMSVPELSSVAATPSVTSEAKLLLQGRMAHPAWSPDGRSVAYIGLKDGSLDLFVQGLNAQLEADGSPKQLTTGLHVEGASSISWSR